MNDLLKTHTAHGFHERFLEIYTSPPAKTMKRAYELTEEEHFNIFGKNRYASYASFNVVRYRDHNTKSKK